MRRIEDVTLSENEKRALISLKRLLYSRFAIEELILFGSVARGDSVPESDIDLLVMTSEPVDRRERHEITNAVFDTNLEFATNFSTLVVDRRSWESGYFSILPIRDEILTNGASI